MLLSNVIKLKSYVDKALVKTDNYSDFNKNYALSIQVSLGGFCFSILDEDRNKHIGFESYLINEIVDYEDLSHLLSSLFDQLDIIKRRFNKVTALFEGPYYSLVPMPLFDENALASFYGFNHNLKYNEEFCFDKLPNLQAYLVYAIATPLRELIKSRFVNYKMHHAQSSFIESLLIKHKNLDIEKRLFVNVREEYLDIIYLKESKLEFCNSFKYNTKEDFAYFLLNVIEELQLNPETIETYLLGNIDKNTEIYELLYKYIRKLNFMERNDFYNYSYAMDELPAHLYYNLLNVGLCEL